MPEMRQQVTPPTVAELAAMPHDELLAWAGAFRQKAENAVEAAANDRGAGEQAMLLAANGHKVVHAVMQAVAGMNDGLAGLDKARSWPVCNNPIQAKLLVDEGVEKVSAAWKSVLATVAGMKL